MLRCSLLVSSTNKEIPIINPYEVVKVRPEGQSSDFTKRGAIHILLEEATDQGMRLFFGIDRNNTVSSKEDLVVLKDGENVEEGRGSIHDVTPLLESIEEGWGADSRWHPVNKVLHKQHQVRTG